MRPTVFLLVALTLGCSAAPPATFLDEGPSDEETVAEGHGVVVGTLLYLPNRVFDLLDIVRLRLRAGPGLGAGVRATELADITIGGWATIFVGLRGPRGEPRIPWPFGFETFAGADVSVLDASTDKDGAGPKYGPLEVGLGFQLVIIGLEVGVAPWEAVDFVVGLLTFDPRDDDL